MRLLCSRLLAQMLGVEERLLWPWGVLLELFSVGSWLKGGLVWPVPGTLGASPFSTFSADA